MYKVYNQHGFWSGYQPQGTLLSVFRELRYNIKVLMVVREPGHVWVCGDQGQGPKWVQIVKVA